MAWCLLGIGANLGDPAQQINEAVKRLAEHRRVEVLAVSRHWVTRPIGGPPEQPPFLNAAALLETDIPPRSLLDEIHAVEFQLGRERSTKWDPRRIDIDILLYGDVVIDESALHIPHPWMAARRFVLGPAAEIAPSLRHPVLGWTIDRLWQHLQIAAPRFALVGLPDVNLFATAASEARAKPIHDPRSDLGLEGSREGSTVAGFPQQLELLERRRVCLEEGGWNDVGDSRRIVSAFWIDECRWVAEATLCPAEAQRFHDVFKRSVASVGPAKLVILATGWMTSEPTDVETRHRSSLVHALRDHLIARSVSPFVEVTTTHPDDVVREVAGAILAMDRVDESSS